MGGNYVQIKATGTAISPAGNTAGSLTVQDADYSTDDLEDQTLLMYSQTEGGFTYPPFGFPGGLYGFNPLAINDSNQIIDGGGSSYGGYISGGTYHSLGFAPRDINNAGLIAGYDDNTNKGTLYDISTSITTTLGIYAPVKVNNASPTQVLDNGDQLWTYDTTNSIYRPINIPDYLADSAWSGLNVASMNDNGVIVGTATYTPTGTTDPIAAGSHGIEFLPISIVRETTPGSGDFEPITDNGLDDNARLPIFGSHTGEGTIETETGAYSMNAVLSNDLSTTGTATINLTYTISGSATYTGTLTETGTGTGIFKDSGGTNILTLTPTTQTTSSGTSTTLSAQITVPSLSISNQPVTLAETYALTYQAWSVLTDVTLSGSLSTTTRNSITALFYSPSGPLPSNVTLTETGTNTRVFQDATGSTTLTMTGFTGGTSMNITASVNGLTPSSVSATLQEIGTGTYQYSNYQSVISTAPDSTPATDGQGIFYVQFPGSTATSITLVSGANQVTVSATPVTGQPNLLRTGKLVVIEPGDSFSASGITTLQAGSPGPSGYATLQIQMYGQTIVDPILPNQAYVGYGVGAMDGSNATANILSVQAAIKDLGWTCPNVHERAIKSEVLSGIQQYNLFYCFTHGLTPDMVHPPLQTFLLYRSSDPKDRYDLLKSEDPKLSDFNLHYTDVATANGAHVYDLVFFNACFSADTTTGSNAANFADKFHAKNWVGWSKFQSEILSQNPSLVFFQNLKGHHPVQYAIDKANNTIGFAQNVLTHYSKLQMLPGYDDPHNTIDQSPLPP